MEQLAAGLALGLGSGLAPGPLLALVVATTLRRGAGAGIQVAAAPLVTDLPIILLSVLALSNVPERVVAGLALAGAVVVAWLAVESLRAARTATLPTRDAADPPAGLAPLRRGALVNLLNPAPWLFWATVGGPFLVATWRDAPAEALTWVAGFYLALVGAKVALAVGLAPAHRAQSTRVFRALLLASGLALGAVSVLLAVEAISALGWV